MTRIKYIKLPNGILHTKWVYIRSNLILRGYISKDNFYTIFGMDGVPLDFGGCKNLRAAKYKVRKKLIEYGLILEDEIRRRV